MVINRVGNVIGVSVDKVELGVISEAHPNLWRGMMLGLRSDIMRDTKRHVLTLSVEDAMSTLCKIHAQNPELITGMPDCQEPTTTQVASQKIAQLLEQYVFETPILNVVGL